MEIKEVLTLGAVRSIYARAFINVNSETSSIPFFHIYTKPTGIGDAAPWYHSKIDYTYDGSDIIGIGEECIFYGYEPPTSSFSNRHIEFKTKTITGDGEDDEEILYMAFGSDSGASQDAVNITTNLLGFDTKSICSNLNLISESSLTGGATEAMQQLQLDQETVIATNTSSMNTALNSVLTITPEINDPVAYTETITVPASGSGNGSPMNTTGYNIIGFAFSSSNTSDPVHLQVSNDSLTFYTIQTLYFPIQGEEIKNPAFKFYRLQQTDTTASGHTISVVVSRRVI